MLNITPQVTSLAVTSPISGAMVLAGTTNRVTLSQSGQTITFTAPQDLHTSATVRFGVVGIGAANSGVSPLEVASSAASSRMLYYSTNANGIAGIELRGTTASVNSSWYIDNRGGNDTPNNRLAFYYNDGTISGERFTILKDGKVGIGTTNPRTQLEIYSGSGGGSDQLRIGAGLGLDYTFGRNGSTGYLDITGAQVGFRGVNFVNGIVQFGDTVNLIFNTTTGSKIGTSTSQKLSLWNATPIVQPTTSVAAATFVANTSGIANDTATFDGYTIGQIVKALRNIGALA